MVFFYLRKILDSKDISPFYTQLNDLTQKKQHLYDYDVETSIMTFIS